jgi:hypothetical protein
MTEQNQQFLGSDAWLLLALLYAKEPADRKRIVEVGDAINHAIFTDEELEGGLARLQAAGHAITRDGRHCPAQGVAEWFERISPKRSPIHKDMERVRGFLGIRDPA